MMIKKLRKLKKGPASRLSDAQWWEAFAMLADGHKVREVARLYEISPGYLSLKYNKALKIQEDGIGKYLLEDL